MANNEKRNKYYNLTLKSDRRIITGEWTPEKIYELIKDLNLTDDFEGLNLHDRNMRPNANNEATYKHFDIKFKTLRKK